MKNIIFHFTGLTKGVLREFFKSFRQGQQNVDSCRMERHSLCNNNVIQQFINTKDSVARWTSKAQMHRNSPKLRKYCQKVLYRIANSCTEVQNWLQYI